MHRGYRTANIHKDARETSARVTGGASRLTMAEKEGTGQGSDERSGRADQRTDQRDASTPVQVQVVDALAGDSEERLKTRRSINIQSINQRGDPLDYWIPSIWYFICTLFSRSACSVRQTNGTTTLLLLP